MVRYRWAVPQLWIVIFHPENLSWNAEGFRSELSRAGWEEGVAETDVQVAGYLVLVIVDAIEVAILEIPE